VGKELSSYAKRLKGFCPRSRQNTALTNRFPLKIATMNSFPWHDGSIRIEYTLEKTNYRDFLLVVTFLSFFEAFSFVVPPIPLISKRLSHSLVKKLGSAPFL
jgi:hypothetical protein